MKKIGNDPFISRYLLSTGQGNKHPTKEIACQIGSFYIESQGGGVGWGNGGVGGGGTGESFLLLLDDKRVLDFKYFFLIY